MLPSTSESDYSGCLANGTCRCIWSDAHRKIGFQFSRRARQQNRRVPSNTLSSVPTIVLIADAERNLLWLCRWSRSGSMLEAGSILCYHKSISVHVIDEDHSEAFVGILKSIAGDSGKQAATWAYEPTLTETACVDPHHHIMVHRRILPEEGPSYKALSTSLLAIVMPPLPLQSLVIEVAGSGTKDSPGALQQASWKRQLVGSIIFFRRRQYTSTVEVSGESNEPVYLTIQSLAAKSASGHFVFVVLPSTRISLQSPSSASLYLSKQRIIQCPPGVSKVTQELLNTVTCMNQSIPVPRSFLLGGPPGVGKTFSVKRAVDLCSFSTKLFSFRGSEILQQHSNSAKALERSFQQAASSTREKDIVVVFLDECDALVSVDTVAAMLATLLDKVTAEWSQIMVVGASNRIDSLPGYLRRAGRFDKELIMTPPNVEERTAILSILFQELQNRSSDDFLDKSETSAKELRRISELCVGYVAADLNALVRKASLLAAQQGSGAPSILQCLEMAMSEVGPSALRDASLSAPPKITWDDVAGDPGGAKTALRQAIEWPRTKPESFKRMGLIPPRGILLHGPPGCAKTTLARAAAGASGVAFLSLSPAEVYSSSYVGEAEAVVRRVFSLARSAAPCVLFFDEIDSIFGGKQGPSRGSSAEARVLSTFLNEMDGVDNTRGADGVLVLGATNRPWILDSALLRPGRLGDKIIYIPPPDAAARRDILEMQFREYSPGINLDLLTSDSATGLMTGAELVGACQQAKLRILREFIEGGYGEVTPSYSVTDIESTLLGTLKSTKPLLSDPMALREFRLFDQSLSGR